MGELTWHRSCAGQSPQFPVSLRLTSFRLEPGVRKPVRMPGAVCVHRCLQCSLPASSLPETPSKKNPSLQVGPHQDAPLCRFWGREPERRLGGQDGFTSVSTGEFPGWTAF